MEQQKARMTAHLMAAVQELPEEKVAEVLDFVGYLQSKYGQQPKRGSAEALLRVLDNGGALQFEPGELDAILAEIDQARDSDLDSRG